MDATALENEARAAVAAAADLAELEDARVRFLGRKSPLKLALREVRAWRPTLIHAATPFGIGLSGRAAARQLGIPFVSSYHTHFSAYVRFYNLGAHKLRLQCLLAGKCIRRQGLKQSFKPVHVLG